MSATDAPLPSGPQAPLPGASLRWYPAEALFTEADEPPDWVIEGLVARSCVTEVTAKIKVGKTHFVTDAIAAVLEGRSFLGLDTRETGVLYLTEERKPTFREALKRVGLARAKGLTILFRGESYELDWDAIATATLSKAREVNAQLVVVDTLSDWANLEGDDENSAGAAKAAMRPLERIASHGLAVVMVRHERKGGGEVGDSARGSSAFGGSADILLSLRRAPTPGHPTRRCLQGVGRLSAVPPQLVLELQDAHYVSLGSSADVDRAASRTAILEVLPNNADDGLTEHELRDRLGDDVSRSTLKRALAALKTEKVVDRRLGGGPNRRAYRYWRIDDVSS